MTTNTTHDIGHTNWFRVLVGAIWAIVLVLAAVGIYTIEPGLVTALLSSTYVLSSVIFTVTVLAVAYVISRQFPLRTPSGQRESFSR